MIKKLKSIIRPYYLPIKYHKKRRDFKRHLSKHKKEGLPLKIVIGSSGIYDEDWIPSEVYILNLLDERTWNRYFVSNAIDAMLAEHVWEHLTLEQGKIAAKTCYKYLKQGGYIRLAVPDGFHNDQKYIDYVKPNGSGAGADDHKVLFNYKSFTSVFNEIGDTTSEIKTASPTTQVLSLMP